MGKSRDLPLESLLPESKLLPNSSADTAEEETEGILDAIIFRNDENGYTVGHFAPVTRERDSGTRETQRKREADESGDSSSRRRGFTATGFFPSAEPGDRLRLFGSWVVHASYGPQFSVRRSEQVLPHTRSEILRFLSAGSLPGIGQKTAEKLVDRFGEDTLTVLRDFPEKVALVRGINREKANRISVVLREKGEYEEITMALMPFGIGAGRVQRIYRRFGSQTLTLIKKNPYRIAAEISGIGFPTADRMAMHFGCDPESPFRYMSAILYRLSRSAAEGDTYVSFPSLASSVRSLLLGAEEDIANENSVKTEGIADLSSAFLLGMTEAVRSGQAALYHFEEPAQLFWDSPDNIGSGTRISLMRTLKAEIYSAKRILEIASLPISEKRFLTVDEDLDRAAEHMCIRLSDEQREAVKTAALHGVTIITGGPGTGKTTIIRLLCTYFKSKGMETVLCAPTGRAAKKMAESSGFQAKTIHRLLEIERSDSEDEPVFRRGEENPIAADAIIVDETSMLDVHLLTSLLAAVSLTSQLILVGDKDQLPSVGPGAVLADIVGSAAVPVCVLRHIFRQAQESRIVRNAHAVLSGGALVFDQSRDSDFMLIHRETPEEIADAVTGLYTRILPSVYGVDAGRDAVVLCPSRKGRAGVFELNLRIKEAAGLSKGAAIERNGFRFQSGDKVMQTRNNYELAWRGADGIAGTGVFNGEIGTIINVNLEAGALSVELDDGRKVLYEKDNLDDLDAAFAMTVHKSQGSEYPVVILAVPNQTALLNNRNLLYTAITRAKKQIFLVSSRSILDRMIRNDSPSVRMTSLLRFLRLDLPGEHKEDE